MSWIRLLNSSPSFSAQNLEPRGYRLTQMNLIPKFGNSTNTAPGAARSAPGATTRKIPNVTPLPRAKETPAPAPTPALASAPMAAASAAAGQVASALRGTVAATMEFCGRLAGRRGAKPAALTGSVRPAVAVQTAQAELKLETLKPVHNDLSDCDYEVRAVRRPVEAVAAEVPATRDSGVFALAGDAVERVRTLFH